MIVSEELAAQADPVLDPQGDRTVLGALVYLAAAIAVLPMLVAAVSRFGSDYFPVHDMAVIDLRLRDVLTSNSPLVGAYSQFGWNHPGPILYWFLTPFHLLSGGHAWGMIIGSAALQGTAVAATVLIAKRAAGPIWAIGWAVVVTLAYVPTGPWILLEAWNPHLAYPFFALFMLLAWRCATVPGSYLPWVTATGSVLIQLHIGYVPLVGVVFLWLAWAIWRENRFETVVSLRTALAQSALILFILWAAPTWQALRNGGGNFRALASYFLLGRGQESRAGVETAGRLVASVFRVPPPWLGGPSDMDALTGNTSGADLVWLVIPGGLLLLGGYLFRRCTSQFRSLLVLSWLMFGTGAVSLALLRGKVAPYLFYWRNIIAIVMVLAVVAAAASLMPKSYQRKARVCVVVVGTAMVVIPSASFAAHVANSPRDVMQFESVARKLTQQISAVDGPVIVRWLGPPLGGVQAGVVNELDRRGFQVGVDRGAGFQWGYQREVLQTDATQVWFVSERGFATASLERLPGAEVIAHTSPLTAAEDADLNYLQLKAAEQLEAAGRHDVITQLDSPLSYFNLKSSGVLNESERRRFLELSEKVAASGGLRAAIIAFDAPYVPSVEQLESLQ